MEETTKPTGAEQGAQNPGTTESPDPGTAGPKPDTAGPKPITAEKVLKGSFWIIAAIHIAVFTSIGLATSRWRLLAIFLIGFVVVMATYAIIKLRIRKNKKVSIRNS
jgi:hypothetical protein